MPGIPALSFYHTLSIRKPSCPLLWPHSAPHILLYPHRYVHTAEAQAITQRPWPVATSSGSLDLLSVCSASQ